MELNTIHDDVTHFTSRGEKVIKAIFISQSRLQDNVLPFLFIVIRTSQMFHFILYKL